LVIDGVGLEALRPLRRLSIAGFVFERIVELVNAFDRRAHRARYQLSLGQWRF
jgi:hypothetical protein